MLIAILLAVQKQNQSRLKTHEMMVKVMTISAVTASAAIINAKTIIDAIATAIVIPVAVLATTVTSKIANAAAQASSHKTAITRQRMHKPAASVKRIANATRVATLNAVQP